MIVFVSSYHAESISVKELSCVCIDVMRFGVLH